VHMYSTECLVTTSLFDASVHLYRARGCPAELSLHPDHSTCCLDGHQAAYTIHSPHPRPQWPCWLLSQLSVESPRRVFHLSEDVTARYEQAQLGQAFGGATLRECGVGSTGFLGLHLHPLPTPYTPQTLMTGSILWSICVMRAKGDVAASIASQDPRSIATLATLATLPNLWR
jgi:hypothetical protein